VGSRLAYFSARQTSGGRVPRASGHRRWRFEQHFTHWERGTKLRMTTERRLTTGTKELPAIDLLRMVAALLVLGFHYLFRGNAAGGMLEMGFPKLWPAAKYGYMGVPLFFVLSGFLISISAEEEGPAAFAWARFVRLYPAFIICVTLTALSATFDGDHMYTASLAQYLRNATMWPPSLRYEAVDGVYWTLVYEIYFYLAIWAMLILHIFPKWLPIIIPGWLILSVANERFIHSPALRGDLLTDLSGYFAMGASLYLLRRSGAHQTVATGLLLLATIVACWQASNWADGLSSYYPVIFDRRAVVMITLAIAGAVWVATRIESFPIPVAIPRAARGITYPLYLLHENIGFMVLNRLAGRGIDNAAVVLVTVAMIAAAWAVWYFPERRAQRFLRSIEPRRRLPLARRAPQSQ
jgi:peptidoglycan/LPS O-acetylase OafA/YrhL